MTKSVEKAIVVKGLKKSYGSLNVLEGIDFEVSRGEILALLGPNGAGKTTAIRILSTLLPPDGGQARVNGFDVVAQGHSVRRSIGLTGQYAAVDEILSGKENLEMMGRLYRLSYPQAKARAAELLEQFDLVEAARRPVKTYSGGMRRRLDLAMSLIASPHILFLDEPTTGLDPRSRLTLWSSIERLAATGVTILLTTQHMEEADHLAHKIIVIDHGKVIAQGTPAHLKSTVGSDYLELTVAQAHFDKAINIFKGETLHKDSKRRIINVAVKNGAKDLMDILRRLEHEHVQIESLSLRRPTLDDVFLSLTGHVAQKEEHDKKSGDSK